MGCSDNREPGQEGLGDTEKPDKPMKSTKKAIEVKIIIVGPASVGKTTMI